MFSVYDRLKPCVPVLLQFDFEHCIEFRLDRLRLGVSQQYACVRVCVCVP